MGRAKLSDESYATVLAEIDGKGKIGLPEADIYRFQEALRADMEQSQGQQAKQVFRFASEHAQKWPGYRSAAIEAVARDWEVIKHLPSDLLADPEIGRLALQSNWEAFRYLPVQVRGDQDIFTEAFKEHWDMLKCASDDIRGDIETVRGAWSMDAWLTLKEMEEEYVDLCDRHWLRWGRRNDSSIRRFQRVAIRKVRCI